jgi:cytochrome P450
MLVKEGVVRPQLDGFSLIDPDFLTDPYALVVRAHREAPVFWDPAINGWVVTKYQDIASILADSVRFSSRAVGRIPVPRDIAPLAPDFAKDEIIFAIDPPEHTLARLTLQYGFTKKVVDGLADHANAVAEQVIDRIIDHGECNLINDFCYAFSLGVIMKMLNLPTQNAAQYRRWAEALFALLTPKPLDGDDQAVATNLSMDQIRSRWNDLAEANSFLRNIVGQRQENPTNDLISAMLQARDTDGNRIDPGAVVRHSLSLIAAGFDTTATLIAHVVLLLSRNPDQLDALKADFSLTANAIEEGLRRRGSTTTLFRIATEDVVVRDQPIARGSMICLLLPGANLDADVFPDPEKFDIRRANANKHLGLGRGRHACVGQPLVRIEAPIGLRKLYERMPDLRIDLSQPVDYVPSFGVSNIARIHAKWTPHGHREYPRLNSQREERS